MLNLKEHLNPAQYEAVTTTTGPVLVIAGAGSGKTRVIEYRVLHLVLNKIKPESILLLTFTRRAAREMLSRASQHDPACQRVNGGTFHSFAYRMLKNYAAALDLSTSFSVLDEGDAEEAIQRCTSRLGFYEAHRREKKRFPKKETLKDILSSAVNKDLSIPDILQKEYHQFLPFAESIELVKKEYSLYKEAKNYLDYDDLLVFLNLLLEKKEIRTEISRRYQYIMVDEYQDTNRLQGEIVYALGSEHDNVMAVGDDAQSIYAFRGATHENIMEFPRRFPGCKVITLEENYRSVQSILDVANPVLENMPRKYPKCLVSAQGTSGVRPVLNYFSNVYEEAEGVANKIEELGHPDQTAVLYRSSYLSIPLQAELTKRGIAYQVFGGLRFYELAHIKDLMAYLKIMVNHRDELAWNRVLMLIDGIGSVTTERMLSEITACADMNVVLTNVLGKHTKGPKSSPGLTGLKKLLPAVRGAELAPAQRVRLVLDYYTPIMAAKFDDWPQRASDLEVLAQMVTQYQSLGDFLADLAIESPDKGNEAKSTGRPLTLSTIHSAKGLEWDTVFIIGLAEGSLPSNFALRDESELAEEQRLLYVALTRAKNNLCLSLPMETVKEGLPWISKVCRFINMPNVLGKITESAPQMEKMMDWNP